MRRHFINYYDGDDVRCITILGDATTFTQRSRSSAAVQCVQAVVADMQKLFLDSQALVAGA